MKTYTGDVTGCHISIRNTTRQKTVQQQEPGSIAALSSSPPAIACVAPLPDRIV
jgi:hypothetical protein